MEREHILKSRNVTYCGRSARDLVCNKREDIDSLEFQENDLCGICLRAASIKIWKTNK